ncbi:MAG: hypothetical protein IH909_03270 [Proteobacteria bacterium]|nr:hypothetical protein [Pseudomonadota bacterium]
MVEFTEMIDQFKITQERVNDITIQLVKGGEFHQGTKGLVIEGLRKILGNQIDIHLDVVNGIDRDPSGKQRAIISRVHAD